MLHLDTQLGSLAKGKDADFVVLSGAPFSSYTQVEQTWIDGKLRFDRSKQRDWSYQAGGYALGDDDRLPKRPEMVKPLGAAKAPAMPKGAKRATPTSKKFAVRAGRIHTVSDGTILDGVIIVEDGKIAAVGKRADVEIPDGTPTLTAAVVTPGLIDAASCLGLSGGANVSADQDQDEKTDPNQADLRVMDGFNPDEGLLEFVRREGVTTIHATPGRVNAIAGQTGVFRTIGRTAERSAIRFPAAMLVNLGEAPKGAYPGKLPTTRMGTAALLRGAFSKARNYDRKASGKEKPPSDAKLEALALTLNRKLPVMFAAHRADDIATALRLAREFDLDASLHLATEGYLMADEIAKAKVPVVIHPGMQRIGGSMETLNTQLANAGVLAAKKIPLALGTSFEGYVPKTRVLRQEAAVLAVNGLGHARALDAITLGAAKVLGIADTRGSITNGKVADLVLYDGDCFEHAAHVTYTLIEGRIVYDREVYLSLPFERRVLSISGGSVGCCLGQW
jgi:imidazolonepropionase-like amidohydrolase